LTVPERGNSDYSLIYTYEKLIIIIIIIIILLRTSGYAVAQLVGTAGRSRVRLPMVSLPLTLLAALCLLGRVNF
jgi:hypothetical protein